MRNFLFSINCSNLKNSFITTINNVQQMNRCSMMVSLVALTKCSIRDTPHLHDSPLSHLHWVSSWSYQVQHWFLCHLQSFFTSSPVHRWVHFLLPVVFNKWFFSSKLVPRYYVEHLWEVKVPNLSVFVLFFFANHCKLQRMIPFYKLNSYGNTVLLLWGDWLF